MKYIPGYLGGTPVLVPTLREQIVNKLRKIICRKQESLPATKSQNP